MTQATSEYISQEVQCADPAGLVELLFQRAIRDLRNAQELWPTLNESPAAIHLIVHAQCILLELTRSLNYAEGGDLANNLARLYEYMQHELSEVVTQKNGKEVERMQDVIDVLAPLVDAWSEMIRQQQASSIGVSLAGAHLVA